MRVVDGGAAQQIAEPDPHTTRPFFAVGSCGPVSSIVRFFRDVSVMILLWFKDSSPNLETVLSQLKT